MIVLYIWLFDGRCGFTTENAGGRFMAQLNAILTIMVFVVNLLCYVIIWVKIKDIGRKVGYVSI